MSQTKPRFIACHGEIFIDPDASVVYDTERDEIVATFSSGPIRTPEDRDSPLAHRQARRAEFLAAALNAAPRIRVGDRVRFIRDADCYPHAYIHAGATGTVVGIVRDDHPTRVEVRMDDPRYIADLLEWDGEFWVQGSEGTEDPEDIARGVIVPDDTPAPLYFLDGYKIDLVTFLRDNRDAPDFTELVADIQNLDPEQGVVIGGGALATFAIVRTR